MDLDWTLVGFGGALAVILSLYFMAQFGVLGLLFSVSVFGVLGFVMVEAGILKVRKQDASGGGGGGYELDFVFDGTAPQAPVASAVAPVDTNEVFLVNANKFTYEQAPAVCQAYGAELASYDEVEAAYNKGGEWCGYGWSEGGMALYPTQKDTYDKQYAKDPKHTCGRPGINGGFFDPKSKFGVNCYGKKPAPDQAELDLMYAAKNATKPADRKMARMVQQIKDELHTLKLSPFNNSEWSLAGGPNSLQTQLASAQHPKDVASQQLAPPKSNGILSKAPVAAQPSAAPTTPSLPNTQQALQEYGAKLKGILGSLGSSIGLGVTTAPPPLV